MNWEFFTHLPKPVGEVGGGMANALVGTFVPLLLASAIGLPVGVLGGVYLSEYGGSRLNWAIRFAADILNGVPSIIWGIVVYALVVVPMKGFSTLAGAMVLGLMMIPLVMRTTEEVLMLVPNSYREAALALGIAQWRTIVQIVMRTALRGTVTGVLLAVARLSGETAPLLFLAAERSSSCRPPRPAYCDPARLAWGSSTFSSCRATARLRVFDQALMGAAPFARCCPERDIEMCGVAIADAACDSGNGLIGFREELLRRLKTELRSLRADRRAESLVKNAAEMSHAATTHLRHILGQTAYQFSV